MSTRTSTYYPTLLLSLAVLLAACDTGSGSSGEEGSAECSPPCSIDYTCDNGVCVEKTYGDPSGTEEEEDNDPLCTIDLSSYGSSAKAKRSIVACHSSEEEFSLTFSGGKLASADGKSCTLDVDESKDAVTSMFYCRHIYDCGACSFDVTVKDQGDAPEISIYEGWELPQSSSCGSSYCCWGEHPDGYGGTEYKYLCFDYSIDSGSTTVGPGECGSWEPCCEDCYDDCGGNSSYGWDSECYSFCISCCHGCY